MVFTLKYRSYWSEFKWIRKYTRWKAFGNTVSISFRNFWKLLQKFSKIPSKNFGNSFHFWKRDTNAVLSSVFNILLVIVFFKYFTDSREHWNGSIVRNNLTGSTLKYRSYLSEFKWIWKYTIWKNCYNYKFIPVLD